MYKRINQVRISQGLTQDIFADKLKVSKNYISQIENGRKVPSERLIDDICEKFSVNNIWLTTGNGEIYAPKDGQFSTILSELEDSDDDFIKDLISVYMELDEDSKAALRKISKAMIERQAKRD